MIFEIDKQFDTTRLTESLNYQYSKIEKGVGELLESSLLVDDQTSILAGFESHLDHFSPRSSVAKYHQVVASFNPEDDLDTSKQMEVINTWMEAMEYDQVHHVIFKHTDTDKDHYHILCTSVKQDGTKLNTYNDYRRSEAVTRTIEASFNLQVLSDSAERKTTVSNEIDRYAYANAIKRLPKSALSHPMFAPISYRPFEGDDHQLAEHYTKQEKEDLHTTLINFIDQNKLARVSNATYLKNILASHREHSSSYTEFINNLKINRLYCRKVYNSKGPSLVFGVPEKGIYFNDYLLGAEFNETNLKKHFKNPDKQLPATQKKVSHIPDRRTLSFKEVSKFVKTMAVRAAKYTHDIESLTAYLAKYQIDVNTQSGRVGDKENQLRSISFNHQEFKIKGSSIGLSGKQIRFLINEPVPNDPNSSILRTVRGNEVRNALFKSLYSSNTLGQLTSNIKQRGITVKPLKAAPGRSSSVTNLQFVNGLDNFTLSDFNLNISRIIEIIDTTQQRNLGVTINGIGDKLTDFKKYKRDIFKHQEEIRRFKLDNNKKALLKSLRSMTSALSRVGASDASTAAYQEQLDDLQRLEYLK